MFETRGQLADILPGKIWDKCLGYNDKSSMAVSSQSPWQHPNCERAIFDGGGIQDGQTGERLDATSRSVLTRRTSKITSKPRSGLSGVFFCRIPLFYLAFQYPGFLLPWATAMTWTTGSATLYTMRKGKRLSRQRRTPCADSGHRRGASAIESMAFVSSSINALPDSGLRS